MHSLPSTFKPRDPPYCLPLSHPPPLPRARGPPWTISLALIFHHSPSLLPLLHLRLHPHPTLDVAMNCCWCRYENGDVVTINVFDEIIVDRVGEPKVTRGNRWGQYAGRGRP